MKSNNGIKYYPPQEEKLNVLSHLLGFILSIVALILLILDSAKQENIIYLISFSIFGASLTCLYAASSSYHSANCPDLRKRLKVLDHAAIYLLIAGTYTPFTLITLKGSIGVTLFCVTWGMALLGIILKLFFTGKYSLFSTVIYVLMGWLILFAINPLLQNFPQQGIRWLVLGGVAYTLGAIIYSIKKIPYNHAVFHLLVLIGSFCHFVAIYGYV